MYQRYASSIVAPAVGAVVVLAGVGLTSKSAAAETVAASYTQTAAKQTAVKEAGATLTTATRITAQDTQAVARWIERNAHRIDTIDPAAPLNDLESLRRSVGNASIVGLGEPAHEVREITALKHRSLRYLVERMGFRSIAWEDDWTLGLEIDEYIRTGKGDPEALLKRTDSFATRECADVLRWLRDFNAGREENDKVRFVGVEYWTTWHPAYDIVDAHVSKVAPSRVPELRKHMKPLRPTAADAWAHARWYMSVTDKKPYVDRAQRTYDLVKGLPHRSGDRAHSLALHAARQILSFYTNYYIEYEDALVYRDARAAENLRWWHGYDQSKIVYWAASPHTAVAPGLRAVQPPYPDMGFPSVGSYLHRWYGTGYRSIGFTFDHGTLHGEDGTVAVPPPAEDWFERPFGEVPRHDQMLLDLRETASEPVAPEPVRRWLEAPIKPRGFVDDHGSYFTGGTLEQWFDVIVHRQEVTPARRLQP
jgi:erythromycin esterase